MKKHIVCLGDSNTHGSCPNILDCEDGLLRFNENERWTCRLQKALGDDYLVLEEGLHTEARSDSEKPSAAFQSFRRAQLQKGENRLFQDLRWRLNRLRLRI